MHWFFLSSHFYRLIPFLGGWLMDRILGDPGGKYHPVALFGKIIAEGEKALNKDNDRELKGCVFSISLIAAVFVISQSLLAWAYRVNPLFYSILAAAGVFFCLSGKTLINEVKAVFVAAGRSTQEGRERLSRIVGRDTSRLNEQEIHTAALESLSENLSDGVIAPMCWFLLLGLPGMMAYKMVNTLDSMIGYKNERYKDFGKTAAKIDDVANYIPARITACLMLFVSGNWGKRDFVARYGKAHSSPNSGYPEAALAAILNCQFGGTHDYSGESVEKPYIGDNPRPLTAEDMEIAVWINYNTEFLMGFIVTLILMI
jgi:adenosylcobinamide-phosphate synthase